MESVILKVVLVLAIIIAGGFLLFFMADILMAIFNGKKDEKIISANESDEVKKVEQQLAGAIGEKEATALVNGAVIENYNPDEEVAPTDAEEEEVVEEEEETEETEEPEDDREAYIEARRKALMERLAKMNDEDEEEEEETEEDEEESEEESDEEVEEVEEVEEEETAEEEEEEVVDLDVEEEEEEEDTSSEELEEARRALEEERATAAALRAELAEAKRNAIATEAAEPVYLTEEEYEARLAVLNERLKVNEKELRQCKKEFIPLRRVKKTLESDEKKLRRKEALVAKQKVVLYGVNNYADIDEEKAKKLAEDLDLLDGLKLSVEHCQEVMSKNEERYPLLERIFTVLSEQNESLKADIERAEQELAEVRAKKGND